MSVGRDDPVGVNAFQFVCILNQLRVGIVRRKKFDSKHSVLVTNFKLFHFVIRNIKYFFLVHDEDIGYRYFGSYTVGLYSFWRNNVETAISAKIYGPRSRFKGG